ncbi:hypothetical protein H6G00_00885 [Leptolyngbya sp. FACHB-541]|uniref:hypothetical protein n=1 Tax=Leptolyngbya sp. FACHB-541 TaxID=2692810 RepID=UPI001685C9BD|nr:hypothetical protein [Leptolyngbya sp. FACHB-541]MBD1995183.1 hypothetical protein [Leptolyngbya sp. FACHB-541]
MTPAQLEVSKALAGCVFLPGSYEKRFARHMAAIAIEEPEKSLTEKQLAFLEKMLHRYRNQLGGLHYFRAVHGEKLLRQLKEAIEQNNRPSMFDPHPQAGDAVLGGQNRKPGTGDAVLGGRNGSRTGL